MNIFNLKLKEFIFILIISIPIGSFLYFINYNKINYEVQFRGGYAVANNFCDNISFQKNNLANDSDISLITKKYQSKGMPINISVNNENIYSVKTKGNLDQLNEMSFNSKEILTDIMRAEMLNYSNFYESIKLHCKSGAFTLYKLVPLDENTYRTFESNRYTKFHLYTLLLLPLIFFYLLLITFKYIKKIGFKK